MLEKGSVVVSTAGRDGGQRMAVLRIAPDGLWLADGKRRPVGRPKRKNPRHVRPVGFTLTEDAMATNRELRRALAAAASSLEGG